MTIFEYILVLLSVILGLSLAQLATGIGELLRSRKAVIIQHEPADVAKLPAFPAAAR